MLGANHTVRTTGFPLRSCFMKTPPSKSMLSRLSCSAGARSVGLSVVGAISETGFPSSESTSSTSAKSWNSGESSVIWLPSR